MKLFLLITLFSMSNLHAEWISKDSALYKKTVISHYKVFKNGSFILNRKVKIKALKTSALKKASVIIITFSPENDIIKINYVKHTKNKKIINIPINKFKIEVYTKQANGYSGKSAYKLSVPAVSLESEIEFSYSIENKVPVLENNFSRRIFFGDYKLEEGSRVTVESEIPLYTHISNKSDVSLQKFQKKKKFYYIFKLKKELYLENIDSRYIRNKSLSDSHFTFIKISSYKNWKDMGEKFTKHYPITNNQYEELKDLISFDSNTKNKEQIITNILSWFSKNTRYFGDWKRVNGGFKPRPISRIYNERAGDCKDLATLLAYILRKYGIYARVALIYRSQNGDPGDYKLATTSQFNHAITYVRLNNTNYWLDPTNKIYSINFIRNDIYGRKALILDGAKSKLLNVTRKNYYLYNTFNIKTIVTKLKNNIFKYQKNVKTTGNYSRSKIRQINNFSRKSFSMFVKNSYINGGFINKFTMEHTKIKDFKLIDFLMKSKYETNLPLVKTPKGYVYALTSRYDKLSNVSYKKFNSDITLGSPLTYNYSIVYKNAKLSHKNYKCKVKSRWLNIKVSAVSKNKSVIIKVKQVVKKYSIKNIETKTKQFRKLVKNIHSCIKYKGVIFKFET